MSVRILVGDVRERLKDIPDGSVQCCVTSPPYFGLRDYGTASWDGGDPGCEHVQTANLKRDSSGGVGGGRIYGTRGEQPSSTSSVIRYRDHCRKCGAVRVDNQIGIEGTLAEYIATLVAVFREVRRVLRDDGTVWLNLGDSYFSSTATQGRNENRSPSTSTLADHGEDGRSPALDMQTSRTYRRTDVTLKPKDLMMVPARVAIALQDDGWYLRSDIIWAKRNCMPESVTDRPTSSHEHIFLLTKQSRYFYDAIAVAEDGTGRSAGNTNEIKGAGKDNPFFRTREGFLAVADKEWHSRNQRNVWHLATEPFPDAHFAVFPTEIPRRCIKAGTSEKGQCAACGAPWVRVVERTAHTTPVAERHGRVGHNGQPPQQSGWFWKQPDIETTGWRPSCSCDAGVVPQTVLDIFAGSGTTGLVADQLGRDAILIDLNPTYAEMASNRIKGDAPMFATVEVHP